MDLWVETTAVITKRRDVFEGAEATSGATRISLLWQIVILTLSEDAERTAHRGRLRHPGELPRIQNEILVDFATFSRKVKCRQRVFTIFHRLLGSQKSLRLSSLIFTTSDLIRMMLFYNLKLSSSDDTR